MNFEGSTDVTSGSLTGQVRVLAARPKVGHLEVRQQAIARLERKRPRLHLVDSRLKWASEDAGAPVRCFILPQLLRLA